MCSCGGPKKPVISQPSSTMSSSGNFSAAALGAVIEGENKQQMVLVEYVGPNEAPFTVTSKVSRDIRYRFANNEQHRLKAVFLGDADFLVGQSGRDGQPMYRIIGSAQEGEHNPAEFVGQPIAA